jgi:hypothetical protein
LVLVAPGCFLWPFIALHTGAVMPWVLSGPALALFVAVAWGIQGSFPLGPGGIGHVSPWPGGTRFIAWDSIVEVSTWTWRGARSILVEGRGVKLRIPEAVDGIGDLATQLLQRAPPGALRPSSQPRERLEQLARR